MCGVTCIDSNTKSSATYSTMMIDTLLKALPSDAVLYYNEIENIRHAGISAGEAVTVEVSTILAKDLGTRG